MRAILQTRASAIAKGTSTLALCCLSLAAFAQAPSAGTPTKHQTQAAEDAYLAGARLLDHNDLTGAENQFNKAATLDPSNTDYARAYTVVHQRHVAELVQESGKARLLGQN